MIEHEKKEEEKSSLRQEINVLITSALYRHIDVRDSERTFYTDKIMSKILKRIDEMPERFEYHDIDYAEGFAAATLKIKEMLKE